MKDVGPTSDDSYYGLGFQAKSLGTLYYWKLFVNSNYAIFME